MSSKYPENRGRALHSKALSLCLAIPQGLAVIINKVWLFPNGRTKFWVINYMKKTGAMRFGSILVYLTPKFACVSFICLKILLRNILALDNTLKIFLYLIPRIEYCSCYIGRIIPNLNSYDCPQSNVLLIYFFHVVLCHKYIFLFIIICSIQHYSF